ncbi:hypothetical protein [Pseudomonas sp.]|uniref:hypothetical protein n=1 Tax=Pseudomonas sp. TaxID=306 RepID=UPI00333E5200
MSCENCEEGAYVIDKLAKLLAEIAVIVNGPEPHDTLWSYHDLPEKVRALKQAPPAAVPAGYALVPVSWADFWMDKGDFETSHDFAAFEKAEKWRLANTQAPPAAVHERGRDPGKPIAELMEQYESEGCDFSDMEWVRKASMRYVLTMPDSQVRCLLYALAKAPPAAALSNPYTGQSRDYRDVESDPAGVLIVGPGAPLVAAPPAAVPADQEPLRVGPGNYYGSLEIRCKDGVTEWCVENYSGHHWEPCPMPVYAALLAAARKGE